MDAINKLLNELINKSDVTVRITNLSNELLETLKIIENCKKDDIKEWHFDNFHKLINEIKSEKDEQKKKKISYELDGELIYIDDLLNKKVLCERCKEKKKENLINKCGNEEMARLLYEVKLNSNDIYNKCIRWIPFNEFGNIEYLAKGGFGEVSKAKWFGRYYYDDGYKERDVVLKKLYNSNDNILDILKEVNKKKSLISMLIFI
jgi:hypothetical protein